MDRADGYGTVEKSLLLTRKFDKLLRWQSHIIDLSLWQIEEVDMLDFLFHIV
jgi:hypothetical protein